MLELTEAALLELRARYDAVRDASFDLPRRMLADLLGQREVSTIAALDRYRLRDEHHAVLDVYVRLGGFPFDNVPELPEAPRLAELVATAEDTDRALAQLGERVELYAVGAEIHAAFDALNTLVRGRRQQLAAALRELDEAVPRALSRG
ncbi:hypothetical protein [Enhygromyxa salina]|nr:hypothetical protein [Enhygromyxa salina]